MKKTNDFKIWTKEIESLDDDDRNLYDWLTINLVQEVRRVDTPKKIIKTMGAIFDIVEAPIPEFYPANPSLYIEDALEYASIETLYNNYMPKDGEDPIIKTLAKTYDGLTNDKQYDQFLIDFCAAKFFDDKQIGGIWYRPTKDATTWEEYFDHFVATPDGIGQAEEWDDVIKLIIKLETKVKKFYRQQAVKTVKTWERIEDPETAAIAILRLAIECLDNVWMAVPSRDYSTEELIAAADLINPAYLAEAKESEDKGRAIKPPLIDRYATGLAKFFKSERDHKRLERSEKHE